MDGFDMTRIPVSSARVRRSVPDHAQFDAMHQMTFAVCPQKRPCRAQRAGPLWVKRGVPRCI